MKAVFFNPTKLRYASIRPVLAIFDEYREIVNTPLSLTFFSHGLQHVEQAASFRTGRNNLISRIKAVIYAMQYSGFRDYFVRNPNSVAVVWNGRHGIRHIFIQAAKDAGVKTLYLELSPIPNSITVDCTGINYENSVPRQSDFFLKYEDKSLNWKYILKYFSQRSLTPSSQNKENCLEQPYIFVALQSEGDSQLRDFGGNFRTVDSFLDAVCEASQAAIGLRKIFIKEHPNCSINAIIKAKDYPNVEIVNHLDTIELCKNADLILTVNSSVGLQALFLEKPVAAAGNAYWSIDGICYRARSVEELKALFVQTFFDCDVSLRNSFLNYLVNEYYVLTSWQADMRCSLPKNEQLKIKKLLK